MKEMIQCIVLNQWFPDFTSVPSFRCVQCSHLTNIKKTLKLISKQEKARMRHDHLWKGYLPEFENVKRKTKNV